MSIADTAQHTAAAMPQTELTTQRAHVRSPFTPIANYGFLSNCHTGALVAPDGTVDWLCVPRFDSPSVFGALLDRGAGGFRFAPFGINVPSDRIYEPGTNSLVTSWKTATGWVVIRDSRAARGTGTTATRGSATRPSCSGRCIMIPVARLGGGRVHAVHRRCRAQRRRRTPDHVRDRRPPRPDRIGARGSVGIRRRVPRAGRQWSVRSAPERRLRCGARHHPAAQSLRSQRIPRRLWPLVQAQADCATAIWRDPDQGIWEARGKPRHYVSSKLMCWVALDRAAKLANIPGENELAASWMRTAAEIKSDILEHGVDERGVLRQHYETDALDASTLLAAIFGFLPRDDPRLRATILAVADELSEGGLVFRYRTEQTDGGLAGKEGTFVICSFWLVSALAIIGETDRARALMDRLVTAASPLGLYAEEFDVQTGRHLGNFPQAFSHLALVEAAARIIVAESLAEEEGA